MVASLLLNRPMPERVRRIGIQMLGETFAEAFSVECPAFYRLPADEALYWFREFGVACIDAALENPRYAALRREDLGWAAFALGKWARYILKPEDDELAELVAYLYRAIDIEVSGSVPGDLEFTRCYFSERYTPQTCAFMSAFDSGFVSGLCGGGALEFSQRITEGCPCCKALFTPGTSYAGAGQSDLMRSLL